MRHWIYDPLHHAWLRAKDRPGVTVWALAVLALLARIAGLI